MLRTAALAVVLAASAGAQVAPAEPARPVPTVGQGAVLASVAVGAGAVTVLFTGPFVVVPVAAATYATSHALGLGPTLGGVAIDAAVGTGVAFAAGAGALYLLVEVDGQPSDLGTAVFAAVAGVVVGSAATGVSHAVRLAWLRSGDGVEVAPAALVAPTGERAAGLSLRVGL